MAQSGRRRRKRRGGHRQPARPGSADHSQDSLSTAEPRSSPQSRPSSARGRNRRARPPAPWGSFPLVELVVLLSIVLLVAGFFVQGTRGVTMIATGVVLGSLAGLELSVREHFAGYRSHTTVLAGAAAVLVIAAGFFLLPDGWQPSSLGLAVGVVVFAAAFYLLREAFKRRSGGVGFRA